MVMVTEFEKPNDPYKPTDESEINIVNIPNNNKLVIDYAGMIIVGADISEFPEVENSSVDTDN